MPRVDIDAASAEVSRFIAYGIWASLGPYFLYFLIIGPLFRPWDIVCAYVYGATVLTTALFAVMAYRRAMTLPERFSIGSGQDVGEGVTMVRRRVLKVFVSWLGFGLLMLFVGVWHPY